MCILITDYSDVKNSKKTSIIFLFCSCVYVVCIPLLSTTLFDGKVAGFVKYVYYIVTNLAGNALDDLVKHLIRCIRKPCQIF